MMILLLAVFSIFFSSLAHLFLKKAALLSMQAGRPFLAWLSPYALFGFGILLSTVVLTVALLRELPLTVLTSLTALSYPMIALLSKFMLQELISFRQWLGIACVCLGVLLFNLG